MKRVTSKRQSQWVLGLPAILFSAAAFANPGPWQLNLTEGVSKISHQVYDLHMAVFWVCVGIGVVVYGAMAYAMLRFRKSKGAVASKFTHNTVIEVIWTTIPVLILIALAYPATRIMLNENNTQHAKLTIRVTGFQWDWRYDYIDYLGQPISKVGFISKLANNSYDASQLGSGINPWSIKTKQGDHDYLLNVTRPMVVPIHTKIRFLITGGDVMHGFWVPALGWQADANPGQIHDVWGEIDRAGVYRGQCAYLCGQGHAYMPIVIKAVTKPEFRQWLVAQEAKSTTTAHMVQPKTGASKTLTTD